MIIKKKKNNNCRNTNMSLSSIKYAFIKKQINKTDREISANESCKLSTVIRNYFFRNLILGQRHRIFINY